MKSLPERLYFVIGAYEGTLDLVKLSSGVLQRQHFGLGKPWGPPLRLEVTPQNLEQFWKQVERAGVLEWAPEYETLALDGRGWGPALRHQGRKLVSRGQ